MASKITIFDHFLRPLTEFRGVATTPRNWVLNDYGRCEFSMSTADPKCTEQFLQFGNFIYIDHIPTTDENGVKHGKLPPWCGMILTPQPWDYGVIHVTAYSAEALLAFRAMPYTTIKGTPRDMFMSILNHAHRRSRNIIIQPGVLDDMTATFSDDLRTNAYDHIKRLIKDSGMDWDVTAEILPKGNLQLYANLYRRKGVETSFRLTNINTEMGSPLLTIQGTPSNVVIGHSQAQVTNDRFTMEARDEESINDYGPLELNQVFMGKHDPTSVFNAVSTRVEQRGRPVKLFNRIALDKSDTFDWLGVGNILKIKEASVGFSPNGGFGIDADARLISMDYSDLTKKAPLKIEVI
jgi:hypothetical protein